MSIGESADGAGRRAVELTRELVRVRSTNPSAGPEPTREDEVAALVAAPLEAAGFTVSTHEFAPGRTSLVATLAGSSDAPPLGLAGHIDTVPLGVTPWSVDPFSGEIADGRLFGRGTSDMKSGIATMVTAAVEAARTGEVGGGLVVLICAGEETGCEGAAYLAGSGAVPRVGALVVTEPTGNDVVVAHKGALWLRLRATGRTAHGSMPHLGDNALTKLLSALARFEEVALPDEPHPLLGPVTSNLSRIHGGQNVNSVPDSAEATVDLRTVPGVRHDDLLARFHDAVGDDAALESITDLPPVHTPTDDGWVATVRERVERVTGRAQPGAGVTYFTDASVLTPATGGPPTVICGPGLAAQAHRTDEHCLVADVEQSVALLVDLVRAGAPRSERRA